MSNRSRRATAQRLIVIGLAIELAAGGAAYLAGWLIDWPPDATLRLSASAVLWGLLGTLPMLAVMFISLHLPTRFFRTLRREIDELLVPPFRASSIPQLALLSVAAGWGEELFFRGLIQGYVTSRWEGVVGLAMGLFVANALFGCAHPISTVYVLMTTALGMYLSALWLAGNNLLIPMVTHAAYDFIVLVYLTRFYGGGRQPKPDIPP